MLKASSRICARVLGGGPSWMADVAIGGDHRSDEGQQMLYNEHPRTGYVRTPDSTAQTLQKLIPNEEGYYQRPLTDLPGVRYASDLPADPITRLFFQTKGDYALFNNSYTDPANTDPDRLQIARRDDKHKAQRLHYNVIYDFCHRLREASEQRKRFVVVPSTADTKGCAEILFRHGLVAGFRDFHNDRAFVVELKYFQNDPVLQVIEPASRDRRVEYVWSPKMMRRFKSGFGVSNHIRIFMVRTHDGRIMDHLDAVKENIGGIGLMMAY